MVSCSYRQQADAAEFLLAPAQVVCDETSRLVQVRHKLVHLARLRLPLFPTARTDTSDNNTQHRRTGVASCNVAQFVQASITRATTPSTMHRDSNTEEETEWRVASCNMFAQFVHASHEATTLMTYESKPPKLQVANLFCVSSTSMSPDSFAPYSTRTTISEQPQSAKNQHEIPSLSRKHHHQLIASSQLAHPAEAAADRELKVAPFLGIEQSKLLLNVALHGQHLRARDLLLKVLKELQPKLLTNTGKT